MIIPVFNPETDDLEKSFLANNYSVGVTSIVAKNTNRFAANDRIMLGEQGQEKTEVVTVSAINADGITLTIGATKFSHSADDPIYKLRFDQIKYYRSTTTETGTYSLISTQDLDVDNANLETIYDDTTGVSTYFYKFTFYHSISTLESAFSDVIGGGGWRRNQVGNIIDEILREVSDQNEMHVTRSEYIGYFNDVNDELTTDVAAPFDFLHVRTTLDRTAAVNYIDFPVDSNDKQTMWKFDRMDYNFVDSTTSPTTDITYTLDVISARDFRDRYQDETISATTEDDRTTTMCLDTSVNRFRFFPRFETTSAGVFYLHYWKFFDDIESEGQIIETPTPKIYKMYCKAQYYYKRGITEPSYNQTADRFFSGYLVEKKKYKSHDRKDQGTSRGFSVPR